LGSIFVKKDPEYCLRDKKICQTWRFKIAEKHREEPSIPGQPNPL